MYRIQRPEICVKDVTYSYLNVPNKESNYSLRNHICNVNKLGFVVNYAKVHEVDILRFSLEDFIYLCEKSISFVINNINFNLPECNCNSRICNMCDAEIDLELIFDVICHMKTNVVSKMLNDMIHMYSGAERLKIFLKSKDVRIRDWFADKIVLSDYDHILKFHFGKNFDISNLQLRDITRLGFERKFGIDRTNNHSVVLFIKDSEKVQKINQIFSKG